MPTSSRDSIFRSIRKRQDPFSGGCSPTPRCAPASSIQTATSSSTAAFSTAAATSSRANSRRSAVDAGNPLKQLWDSFLTWAFSYDYPRQPEYGLDNGKDFPEVAAALNGASVSLVRLNDRGQIIVLVSVPVQRYRAVLGALVLSTSGGEIDNVLRAERHVVLHDLRLRGAGHHPALGLPCRYHRGTLAQARCCRRTCAARHQQACRDPGLHRAPRRDRRSLGRDPRHDDMRSTTASTPSRPSPPT